MIGTKIKFTINSNSNAAVFEGIILDKIRTWYSQGGTGMTNSDSYLVEKEDGGVVVIAPQHIKKIIRN